MLQEAEDARRNTSTRCKLVKCNLVDQLQAAEVSRRDIQRQSALKQRLPPFLAKLARLEDSGRIQQALKEVTEAIQQRKNHVPGAWRYEKERLSRVVRQMILVAEGPAMTSNQDSWAIGRRHAESLSVGEFRQKYTSNRQPVVITGLHAHLTEPDPLSWNLDWYTAYVASLL